MMIEKDRQYISVFSLKLAKETIMKMSAFYLFLLFSIVIYGEQPYYQSSRIVVAEKIQAKVIEEQPESIAFYCDGKLYLKSDHLQLTPQGIVLNLGNSSIPIPILFSNENGCYLESDIESLQEGPIMLAIICKKCGKQWWYNSRFQRTCPRCGTPP